jgi:hypothetical protein
VGLPDFLVVGAPKAGSTALHAALVQHPQLFLSAPKEPKFFLTGERPPSRSSQQGPGDAHSAREWIWRRADYEALFDAAPPGTLRGESTPFYLWDSAAHRRIHSLVPHAKLIAVIRDPVERAYSNWTHLWCDGLETERTFLTACAREPYRAVAGYAPFWRYLELGKYGSQLQHLFQVFPREQVHVVRYRAIVDEPAKTLDAIADFLGVAQGQMHTIPRSNLSGWADDSRRDRALRRLIRSGARAGAYAPPQAWRRVERPLTRALRRGGAGRPELSVGDRRALVPFFRDDVALLEDLLGESFQDWLGDSGRGTYAVRSSLAPSARAASQ